MVLHREPTRPSPLLPSPPCTELRGCAGCCRPGATPTNHGLHPSHSWVAALAGQWGSCTAYPGHCGCLPTRQLTLPRPPGCKISHSSWYQAHCCLQPGLTCLHRFFFSKCAQRTVNAFSLPYEFLNVFFSLKIFFSSFKITEYTLTHTHMIHITYKICISWMFILSVEFPVNSRLN